MSVDMESAADAILQAAGQASSLDEELSEVDVEGDGSSSLSDIEDKDPEQDEDEDEDDEEEENSDGLSNRSEDENDSEAETERLEESPNKFRAHKDVVLNPRNGSQTYERSSSKHSNRVPMEPPMDDPEEEEEEPLSDDDLSTPESPDSPKSSVHEDAENEIPTVPTSLDDSSGENKPLLSVADADSRKRKRSIMAGSGFDDDLEEPVRKRTGSVLTAADDYAVEDDTNAEEEGATSHPSGNISGDEAEGGTEGGVQEDADELPPPEEETVDTPEVRSSPKRRGRKKRKAVENGVLVNEDIDSAADAEIVNGHDDARNGEDENAENEGDDEAEAAQRNEEELEKKRAAHDRLGAIEDQFMRFRERLYDERVEQLNQEEAMLRRSKPTHPLYLEMMQCIDARRDDRIRIGDKLQELGAGTHRVFAVGRRSQIMGQYQQEVREMREQMLEELGKKWHATQHDRRSFAGNPPEYTLKFPSDRPKQVRNQIAYSNEVSILSGIAKHIGFPAAPAMGAATAAEIAEDFEKWGRPKSIPQAAPAVLSHELAAFRSAGSTTRLKPAHEQFLEQTPWANPQHPAHAHHLLQRQASAQQIPRNKSPFVQPEGPPRRHSHQPNGPVSGVFSTSTPSMQNGVSSGGRVSPLNPFTNSHSYTIAPSPLGSRQPSLSPQQNRAPPAMPEQRLNVTHPPDAAVNGTQASPHRGHPRDFLQETRREQAPPVTGQF